LTELTSGELCGAISTLIMEPSNSLSLNHLIALSAEDAASYSTVTRPSSGLQRTLDCPYWLALMFPTVPNLSVISFMLGALVLSRPDIWTVWGWYCLVLWPWYEGVRSVTVLEGVGAMGTGAAMGCGCWAAAAA